MIGDLGEWAESRFSTLCAARGVTRNKATQDRTGWDYLVEFAPNEIPHLPVDLQPAGVSARVQVKSRGRGKPRASLKLSNALRFAKAAEPCFVVLFLATNGDEPVRIYAKHFWEDLIGDILRCAREADAAGKTDMHLLTFPIIFLEEDEHSEDLIDWMKRQIDAVGGLYAEKKNCIRQTVGMEDGGIHGIVTINNNDWSEIVDHQIGLTPNAPVQKVIIRQRRFGIDSAKPLISFKPDSSSMRSHPQPCRVRIRGKGVQEVWLKGNLLAPTFPNLPPEYFKVRVQADFFDLISAFDRGGSATINWSPVEQRSLKNLRSALDVAQLIALGPIDVQVRLRGQVLLDAECKIEAADRFSWASRISGGLKVLEAVSGQDVPPDLTLSVRDIDAAWNDIVQLCDAIEGVDLSGRLTFREPLDEPLQATSFWTYDYANVGEWTFLAIASRPIIRAIVDGPSLELVCGTPVLVEGLVRNGRGEDLLEDLRRLYQSRKDSAGEGAIDLLGGHWRVVVGLLKQTCEGNGTIPSGQC